MQEREKTLCWLVRQCLHSMYEKPVQCHTFPINTAFFLAHLILILFVNCVHTAINGLLLLLVSHFGDLKWVDRVPGLQKAT